MLLPPPESALSGDGTPKKLTPAVKRDPAIVTLRIIAMTLIVITHLASAYGVTALWYIARIGTPLFFLMSGFLYGQRNIGKWRPFYVRRWKSLCIPIYLWVAIVGLMEWLLFSAVHNKSIYATLLLNLQGISFKFVTSATPESLKNIILCNGYIYHMKWVMNLWFMTYLMVFLFMLPVFQRLKNHYEEKGWWLWGWTPVVTVCIGSVLLMEEFGLNTWYIIPFTIGYFVNKRLIPKTYKGLISSCILIPAGIVLREYVLHIYGVRGIDINAVDINGYYHLSHLMIICGLIGITQFLFHRHPTWKGLPDVGNLTYCIYITHYFFRHLICNNVHLVVWEVLLFLGCTLASALILQKLAKWAESLLFSPRRKKEVHLMVDER